MQVKAVCGQLEVNVTEQMQRSSNELQTLDYRFQHPFSLTFSHPFSYHGSVL